MAVADGASVSGTVQTLANLGVLTFVVSSMLAMGLGLTVAQILASLRAAGLVLRALAANFVLVPAVALLILFVLRELGKHRGADDDVSQEPVSRSRTDSQEGGASYE